MALSCSNDHLISNWAASEETTDRNDRHCQNIWTLISCWINRTNHVPQPQHFFSRWTQGRKNLDPSRQGVQLPSLLWRCQFFTQWCTFQESEVPWVQVQANHLRSVLRKHFMKEKLKYTRVLNFAPVELDAVWNYFFKLWTCKIHQNIDK